MRTYTPWKDRPDSLIRGYVAGSMIGGWACVVLYALLLVLGMPGAWLPAALFLILASLATYMWNHG